VANIRVPDLGKLAVTQEGLPLPMGDGESLLYEVTDAQAVVWNSLSKADQLSLTKKADENHKDLRTYL
jgi:hypothetical protein